MTKFSSLTNHFLIAMPTMEDPNFFQAVTYICEHNENGALGIVINRPTPVYLAEVLQQLKIKSKDETATTNDLPILYGGPIHPERGFVIHTPGKKWHSTYAPSDKIAITSSRDILQAIADNKGPENAIVTLGHAGWGEGQLEQEVAHNTWLTCVADETIIFHTPFDQRWAASAALLGIKDIFSLSGDSGHA